MVESMKAMGAARMRKSNCGSGLQGASLVRRVGIVWD